MTTRELMDWMRFETEWPLPDRRDDWLNALICLMIANVTRSPDQAPAQLGDFLMLKRREPAPPPPKKPVVPEISTAERFRIAMYGG
jgi:hypothetical protein